jgi:hypothetical protein
MGAENKGDKKMTIEDMLDLAKKVIQDSLNAGRVPGHLRKRAERYARTGLPCPRSLANFEADVDWSEGAIRFAVAAEMWGRSGAEVERDGTYNDGFVRRYHEMCSRYGITPDQERLKLCLIV